MPNLEPYYEDEDAPYKHARLCFPKDWIGTKLPAQWKHPAKHPGSDQTYYFQIDLLDTRDGKVYKTKSWPHYEDAYAQDTHTTINIYMFLEHYCACHRKCDARDAGADTDEECEGERFVVKSITCPTRTGGLVLYSETDDANTLTDRCLRPQGVDHDGDGNAPQDLRGNDLRTNTRND
jgi:hypothetical protein